MRSLGKLALHALVFVLALELTVRTEDWVRFGTPFLSRLTSIADLSVRDADGVHGRPDARFQKWVMNNVGTRGPNVPVRKSAGTVRVVTTGASETFGLYESPNHEYPRQLEDTLRARLARCRSEQFEVLNAAFPGMSLPTITQDVTRRIVRLAPDVVFLYPTPTQYLVDDRPTPAPTDSTGRAARLAPTNVLYPRVLDRLRDQAKSLAPRVLMDWLRTRYVAQAVRRFGPDGRFTTAPTARLDAYEADLRAFVGAVHTIGAEPILATHGDAFVGRAAVDSTLLRTWERFYPRASGATILEFERLAAERTRRVAADSAVALVDLRVRLSGAGDRYFRDYAHFTDEGAAVVAGTVGKVVVDAALRRDAACAEGQSVQLAGRAAGADVQ